MPSIVLDRDQLVVGVDTHKQEHVAVAVDGLGRRLGDVSIPATPTTPQCSHGLKSCIGIIGRGASGRCECHRSQDAQDLRWVVPQAAAQPGRTTHKKCDNRFRRGEAIRVRVRSDNGVSDMRISQACSRQVLSGDLMVNNNG
jgi:hypothetical protein